MKKLLTTLAIGTALCASPLALANEIDATNPQQIANLLKQSESDASDIVVGKDYEGDPKITYKQNDTKQFILFYGCTNGKNCRSIQFAAGWDHDNYSLKEANAWNAKERFAKVYLDDDNDPRLEMDVDLKHKVSKAYLAEMFDTWDALVISFKDSLR